MNATTPFNDTLAVARPPIRPANFSKPYWDGTRERKLLLQYCPVTRQYQFFPRPVSLFTGRRQLEWREVSGNGSIYTYTIARLGIGPFHGHEPFAIAMVALVEGVHIMADLVRCDAGKLKIGLPVIPYWLPNADGTHLLMFQPA